MNITCNHCQARLNIPDEKIPVDKDTAVGCPKCKQKITIKARPQPAAAEKRPAGFSFEDRQSAMVCIGDAQIRNQLDQTLQSMGYEVLAVKNAAAALDKLEYHVYHLVVIDEAFDQNLGLSAILEKINMIDMSVRRRIVLVLLSDRYKTNDHMAALHASVNNILNREDMVHIEPFIHQVVSDHKNLYTVYNESLKHVGKA